MVRKLLLLFMLLMVIAGCASANQVTEEDLTEYEVKQTFDEQIEDDFIFRLISEKSGYERNEKVVLYGEIIYTGKEKLPISHAASAVIFNITEQIRDYEIPFAMNEIGLQTELIPNQPYRQDYEKQFIIYSEEESGPYVEFMKSIRNVEGFPAGYYTVEATTAFYDGTEHREMQAEVDFKVRTSVKEK